MTRLVLTILLLLPCQLFADEPTPADARIIWTPLEDGRVRQHWQSTSDQGKTWVEVFDGYYSKD